MIIPIRCFSCGRPIAQLWEEYKKRTLAGEDSGKVLDELGVKSYCCRSMFIGHVDMIEKVSKFKKS
ncbi:MAG: DNA-directed RNA polymerase subunit N [Nanoarchaeota archaeon]